MALPHGGRLRAAARRYDIPLEDWLDLSTGISPWSWPVPVVPESVWRRLPEEDDGLEAVARAWAGVPDEAGCVPVPGSQAAIQLLPRLRAPSRVGVPRTGYAEHARCWQAAGHEVVPLESDDIESALDALDVLVWVHPNNPTGEVIASERLLGWHEYLAGKGGWLVLDEAFVEVARAESLAPLSAHDGLFILRSVGKFFGLAGLRGGFLIGPYETCRVFSSHLGPWAVNGPARWLMARALADTTWQEKQKARLVKMSDALRSVLAATGFPVAGGTALFQYALHDDAPAIQEYLAGHGVLVRCFRQPRALRFGLPGDEAALSRLQALLSGLSRPRH